MSKEKEKEKKNETALARRGSSVPALWAGDPFGMMRRFAEEIDRIFEDFGFGRSLLRGWPFGGRRWPAPRERAFELATWAPPVEVFQRDDRLVIRADLPGLTKDDVQVEVTDDAVTIRGERRQEHEERREGYYHSERSYGSFFRSIPLPEGAATDQAEASFRDGVLEVTMPAPREASRGRRIEIKS